jgi:hypothetical protein
LLIEDAASDFKDVSKDAWYYPFVAIGKSARYNSRDSATGASEQGKCVTRQEYGRNDLCHREACRGDIEESYETPYPISGAIADYAKESISALYKRKIISGMG